MTETEPYQFELLKNPVMAELLGFKQDDSYSEEELESAIITHLQEFLMEMGRGFAFMGRQQLVRTDTQDYFIDLVFYNVVLTSLLCLNLIDARRPIATLGEWKAKKEHARQRNRCTPSSCIIYLG